MSALAWLPGQYAPGESYLHKADMRAKVCATAVLATGAALADSWVGWTILAASLVVVYMSTHLPIGMVYAQVRPFIWFGVVAVLLGSGNGGVVLWQVGTWQYTTADLTAGVRAASRLLLLVSAGLWLSITSSPTMLVQGLHATLSPLRWLGIPVNGLIMTLWIALRFLPVLAAEAARIKKAQAARGSEFASGISGVWRRMSSLVVPLFAAALRRADTMADALVVRGYRAGATHFTQIGRWQVRDWLLVIVSLIVAITAATR